MDNKNLDFQMHNNKNLLTNSTNISKDLDKTLNRLKTLREEFNNLFLKILILESNFMALRKTWDCQPNNNKSCFLKSTYTRNRLPPIMLSLKLIEWKSKSCWMKITNLVRKLEMHNRILDCQLHRSVNWIMSSKLHAINTNN